VIGQRLFFQILNDTKEMNHQERIDKLFAEIVEGQKEVKLLEVEIEELRTQERVRKSQLSVLVNNQVNGAKQFDIHSKITNLKRSIESTKKTIDNIDSRLEDRRLAPEERRRLLDDKYKLDQKLNAAENEISKLTTDLVLAPSLRKIETEEILKIRDALEAVRNCGRLKLGLIKIKKQELTEKRQIYSTYLAISDTTKVIPIPDMIGGAPKEEILDSFNVCVVCFERERNHILLPCGEYIVCSLCGKDLKVCPVCKTNVESIVKMRL
jgi:hypothetical protein